MKTLENVTDVILMDAVIAYDIVKGVLLLEIRLSIWLMLFWLKAGVALTKGGIKLIHRSSKHLRV